MKLLYGGKREPEAGAGTDRSILDADASPIALDDPLAEGEPDPAACVLGPGVEALEHAEDPLAVAGLDANAVVGHTEPPLVLRPFRRDGNFRDHPGGHELQGVGGEVLEDLAQL